MEKKSGEDIDIDLVYLWVDGNDPVWRKKYDVCMGKKEEEGHVQETCKGRYANNDELKYSLRSIEMYAPWIRKVFIVTDNQVPAWLDSSNPRIKIIDHTEIMPAEALPCFNSTVIEHFIYKIPGLSEYFLYANDDTFLGRPVEPGTFFTRDHLPIIRFRRKYFKTLRLMFKEKVLRKPVKNYDQIIKNAAELVKGKYGIYYRGRTHHNIDAYLKSNCRHAEEVFREEIEATFANHVRSADDIHRHLYAYVALAEKRGHLQCVTKRTSMRLRIEKDSHYRRLARFKPTFFCMNDSEYVTDNDRMRSRAFLEKRFPEKSQFEK